MSEPRNGRWRRAPRDLRVPDHVEAVDSYDRCARRYAELCSLAAEDLSFSGSVAGIATGARRT